MSEERRIYGPPGTGKTELLASTIIPQAVEAAGYDRVLVCSLTKTGARTIASRTQNINPNNVGTIHKICFKALGSPKLTAEKIGDWNDEYPQFLLSGSASASAAATSLDEGGGESASGDTGVSCDGEKLMSQMNILRSKLIPHVQWPEDIKAFKILWDDFKERTGTVDFTDLIETANRDLVRAPGNPDILVVDEAQDTNPLQLNLLREWAKMMEWHVLVGDDDQTIYEFAGCTAEAFLNPPIAEEFKSVLSQSYRVPAKVHHLAQYIIQRVSVREPKQYYPRRHENGEFVQGAVTKATGSYKKIDYIIDEIIARIDQGKTVMFLTSCAYMIDPIKAKLVEAGIPFENEFRRRRSDWNPLFESRTGVSSKKLLKNFIMTGPDGEFWTVEQFVTWAKFLTVSETGLVKKVGKKAIEVLERAVDEATPGIHSTRDVVGQILSPLAIDKAIQRDIMWLGANVQKSRIGGMQYPLRVINKYGIDALDIKPKLTIGTIHSVKGGQADCVFVCPDISSQAAKGCMISVKDNDSMNRLFYVAVTRAREEVVVLDPATKYFFRF